MLWGWGFVQEFIQILYSVKQILYQRLCQMCLTKAKEINKWTFWSLVNSLFFR